MKEREKIKWKKNKQVQRELFQTNLTSIDLEIDLMMIERLKIVDDNKRRQELRAVDTNRHRQQQ